MRKAIVVLILASLLPIIGQDVPLAEPCVLSVTLPREEVCEEALEEVFEEAFENMCEETHEEIYVHYILTSAERDLVERVVMAEAGGEGLEGQMLVAQCILNACLLDEIRPFEAIEKYSYTKKRPEATAQVKDAVSKVFDYGETITDEPVLYFYAPKLVKSKWHESQVFVLEHKGHRFFKRRDI